ncbi:hypothetical protein DE146DRAFT_609219 [Phaeosphaeria sp. MPI-PUGE-AT-0046c]|nr:hypothetical protein DE146DRAFT_609219 [Phaeosphaeria sp. MPI-PUGE-AT-0046c]
MVAEPGRRRGIPYNNPDFVQYFHVKNAQVGWIYNWYSTTHDTHSGGFEYVPMLWGIRDDMTANWLAGAQKAADEQPDSPTHLLSFNEPDNCEPGAGSSCIPIAAAVTAWHKYMQPAKSMKPKIYLGSPAVTNAGTPTMGLAWLRAFLAACHDCAVDFLCVHWYDAATNVAYFKNYMNDVREVAAGRPIWITEFAPTGTVAEIKAFLDEVIPWMDASGDIHRYAYFMARENSLVNPEGNGLSELGKHFVYWRSAGRGGFTTEPE